MKNYFCILLTLILIFKHSNNNFITFPFKKILPSDIGVDETNFYSKHENNVIFTNIKIKFINLLHLKTFLYQKK